MGLVGEDNENFLVGGGLEVGIQKKKKTTTERGRRLGPKKPKKWKFKGFSGNRQISLRKKGQCGSALFLIIVGEFVEKRVNLRGVLRGRGSSYIFGVNREWGKKNRSAKRGKKERSNKRLSRRTQHETGQDFPRGNYHRKGSGSRFCTGKAKMAKHLQGGVCVP